MYYGDYGKGYYNFISNTLGYYRLLDTIAYTIYKYEMSGSDILFPSNNSI